MNKNRNIFSILVWLILAGILITAIVFLVIVAKDILSEKPIAEIFRLQPTPEETPTPQLSPTPYVFTGKTVQLAWFYRPPSDGNLSIIAETFDTFVLTKQDYDERDTLKSMGVTAPILQYLHFENIHDPGGCDTKPWRNQVAYNVGDFCMISEQHQDWFLLDANGNRIVTKSSSGTQDYAKMDPDNPGWRAFWLDRAREGQEVLGWDGTFLDNVEASLAKHEESYRRLLNYPDDASYQAAIEDFLKYLYTNYYAPFGRPLYANIIAVRDPAVWFRYMQYLDGAMIEGWAVDWDDGYFPVSKWEEQMDRAERTQWLGKEVILVSQGDRQNLARQEFAFACYLLINHGRASFRYANYRGAYPETWLYGTYYIDIGEPIGTRYQDGDVWRRDFTGGSVMVDPVNHIAEITTRE